MRSDDIQRQNSELLETKLSDFMNDLVRDILAEDNQDIREQLAMVLLDFVEKAPSEQKHQVIWLQPKISVDGSMYESSLDILVYALDLQRQEVQGNMLRILNCESIKNLPNADRSRLYSNLALLECDKESGWSSKMAGFFVMSATKNMQNAMEGECLKIMYSKRILADYGVILSENLKGQKLKDFFVAWNELAKAVLNNDERFKVLSFRSVAMLLLEVGNMAGEDYRAVFTKLLFENKDKILGRDVAYLCMNVDSYLDLATVASYLGENKEKNVRVAEFIRDYWRTSPRKWWDEISEISSADIVFKLLMLVYHSTECQKVFVEGNKDLPQYIGENYLLYRSYLSLLKQNDPSFVLRCDEAIKLLELKGDNLSSFGKMQKSYLSYISESFAKQGKITVNQLPRLIGLDVGFFCYLAQNSNFEFFRKLTLLYCDDSEFGEIVNSVKSKIIGVSRERSAYHYCYFLDKVAANISAFRQDDKEFLRSLFKDLASGVISKNAEHRNDALQKIKSLQLADFLFPDGISSASDAQIIAAVKAHFAIEDEVKEGQGIDLKKQKKKILQIRGYIINRMISDIAKISEYKTEEELCVLLGDRKTDNREYNIRALREYFLQNASKSTSKEEVTYYQNLLLIILKAQEEFLELKAKYQISKERIANEQNDLENAKKLLNIGVLQVENLLSRRQAIHQTAEALVAGYVANAQNILTENRFMQVEDVRSIELSNIANEQSFLQEEDSHSAKMREYLRTNPHIVLGESLAYARSSKNYLLLERDNLCEQLQESREEHEVMEKLLQAEVKERTNLADNLLQEKQELTQKCEVLQLETEAAKQRQEVLESSQAELQNRLLAKDEQLKAQSQRSQMAVIRQENAMNMLWYNLLMSGVSVEFVALQKANYDVAKQVFSPSLRIDDIEYADQNFIAHYHYHHQNLTAGSFREEQKIDRFEPEVSR